MFEIQTKTAPLFLSEREENERIVNGINYPITTREIVTQQKKEAVKCSIPGFGETRQFYESYNNAN